MRHRLGCWADWSSLITQCRNCSDCWVLSKKVLDFRKRAAFEAHALVPIGQHAFGPMETSNKADLQNKAGIYIYIYSIESIQGKCHNCFVLEAQFEAPVELLSVATMLPCHAVPKVSWSLGQIWLMFPPRNVSPDETCQEVDGLKAGPIPTLPRGIVGETNKQTHIENTKFVKHLCPPKLGSSRIRAAG